MHRLSPLRAVGRAALAALDRLDATAGLTDDLRERGAATVEFVILLPVFLAVFLSSFEASLLLTRQVMLERGVDIAAREIRLDSGNTVTQNELRNEVCDRARILPNCRDNMLIELTEISRVSYDIPSTSQPCINRETAVTPPADYEGGRANKLILMRACFAVSPFMPGVGLGTELVSDIDGSSIRMVAATAFVVEPN